MRRLGIFLLCLLSVSLLTTTEPLVAQLQLQKPMMPVKRPGVGLEL